MKDTIITKKFEVTVTPGDGIVVESIFGVTKNQMNWRGFIEQVIVRQTAGTATSFDMQLRGDKTSSNYEDLYYDYVGATLPLVDSLVWGPFDTYAMEDKNLSIYLEPDAAGTFIIRIDFRVLGMGL